MIHKYYLKKFYIFCLTISALLMACSATFAINEIKYYKSWICDRNHYEYGVTCVFKNAKELNENELVKLEKYFEVYFSDGRLEYAFMFVKIKVPKEILGKGNKDYPSHMPIRKFEYDSDGRVIRETINPFTKKFQIWETFYGIQRVESRGYDVNGELFSTWIAIYKNNWRIKKTGYVGPQEKYFGYQTYDHKTGLVKTFNAMDELILEEKESFLSPQ